MYPAPGVASVIAVIGSLAAGVVLIIKAIGDNSRITNDAVDKASEASARAGEAANKSTLAANKGVENSNKLDRIEILVDGRYSAVLQELADVKKLLADRSGEIIDRIKADGAQANADAQEVRVKKSREADNNPPKL